jgi:hypothetical protein
MGGKQSKMESSSEVDFGRIHSLAVGMLEGTLAPAERQNFEALLLENGAARRAYLEHMQESACLRWICVEQFADAAEIAVALPAKTTTSSRSWTAILTGGLLASVVAVAAMQFLGPAREEGQPAVQAADNQKAKTGVVAAQAAEGRTAVATITALNVVQFESPENSSKVLSRCEIGDRLRIQSGSAELTFDAGAQIMVFGPAEFEITSPTSIRCSRGRVTTLVDERGRGFTIETPRAKVVDLGTQFGLSISDDGETEVVVFQGTVDVMAGSAQTGEARRMEQGEAILVKNSGELERVMSVERNSFMNAGDRVSRGGPVIADVQDNIRNARRAKSYQIVHAGLEDDALAFVDRFHQWNGLEESGLPPFLAGADYVMPFNEDKFVSGLTLKVTLARPATLFVFIDNNMVVPDWMRDEFTDTGVDIGLDCSKTTWHKDHALGMGSGKSIDFTFSVWKRDIQQAGTVTLGGVETPADRRLGFNMYGIAAVANEPGPRDAK